MFTAVVRHNETRLSERGKGSTKEEAERVAKTRLLLAYPDLKGETVRTLIVRTSS